MGHHYHFGRYIILWIESNKFVLTLDIQENQQRYPRIFRVAMDILPIQASSVACERVFSSGKETMAPRRNRISSDLMEELQILKFAFKAEESLNFTQGMNWEEELREFEALAADIVPADLRSYVRSLNERVVHD